jgi:AraC-like DNA-binding protein
VRLLKYRSAYPAQNENTTLMEKAQALLTKRFDEWPRVPDVAADLGVSVSWFYTLFRRHTGLSPTEFMQRARIAEACKRLSQSDDTVTDIALSLGYPSSQYFATVFRKFTGHSPTEWRRKSSSSDVAPITH